MNNIVIMDILFEIRGNCDTEYFQEGRLNSWRFMMNKKRWSFKEICYWYYPGFRRVYFRLLFQGIMYIMHIMHYAIT